MTCVDYVGIAALLTGEVAARIGRWSRCLAKECGSWYLVGDGNIPAHLTVWLAYIPKTNIQRLIEHAKEAVRGIGTIEVELGTLIASPDGHIGVDVARNSGLDEAHQRLLAGLNHLREGYIPEKYLARWEQLADDERASIQQYGTRFAGKSYKPHITVGIAQGAHALVNKFRRESAAWSGVQKFDELTAFRQATPGKSIERLGVVPLY